MRNSAKYKDILLEHFYYNQNDNTVRRAKDGYHGRYKKDDIVVPYKLCTHGYNGVHIPTTRKSIPYHHLILILNGKDINNNEVVDHLDGNTFNNDLSNIRIVSQSINCKNTRKRKTNTTGITGVNKSSNCDSYIVRKQVCNQRVYFGSVKTLKEAQELLDKYKKALKQDGYTERHGK